MEDQRLVGAFSLGCAAFIRVSALCAQRGRQEGPGVLGEEGLDEEDDGFGRYGGVVL